MDNKYHHVMVCSFVYFACTVSIYSVHDFSFQLIHNLVGNMRSTFLYFSLNIVRMLASIVNNILHKNGYKIGVLLSMNIFFYALSLISFILLKKLCAENILFSFFTICLYFFGCGGLYSCLDGTITSILSKNDLMDYYGVSRVFIIFGHVFSYVPGLFIEGTKEKTQHMTKLLQGVFFALLSSLFSYIFLRSYDRRVVNTREKKTSTEKSLLRNRKFIFLTIIIFFQGVMKAAISITQRMFFQNLHITENQGNNYHLFRNCAEILLSYFTIIKSKSVNILILVSLLCALFRPVLYAYLAYFRIDSVKLNYLFYVGELSKSVLSTIWGYGVSRKIHMIIDEEHNVRAQSIYNTVYIGISVTVVSLYTYAIYNDVFINTLFKLYLSVILCGLMSLLFFWFTLE